jgi:hypothetical protein
MSRTATKWYRTGECRIVPWWFGLMRAEFFERRDFKDETGEVMEYQLRTVRAGRLPARFDGPSAFGFWSTLASKTANYGDRAIWRQFISYFTKLPDVSENDKQ